MTVITARFRNRVKPVPIAINDGHPARFRTIQMIAWSAVIAACGAALVAGLYFNVLQVRWVVAGHQVMWLKNWWDGGMGWVTSGNWDLYRHGIRDLGEPALATLVVKTLTAKQKTWDKRAGVFRLIISPVILTVITGFLAVAGVWVIDFGSKPAWHPLSRGSLPPALWQTAGTLILGFVIGQVIHPIWAPCGATIQGHLVDRAVDRSRGTGRVPLWVRWPVAPLQLRERFVWLRQGDQDDAALPARSLPAKVFETLLILLVAYLVVTGFIAHFWIGSGHAFPYLAP